MTTITANKEMMVSDSRVSFDSDNPLIDDLMFSGYKLYRKGEAIIGACGSNSDIENFVKWYGTRKKKPTIQDKEFSALVLTKRGLFIYDAALSRDEVTDPFIAIGSGGNAAKAALLMGADLVKAVEIAIQVDKHSGPPIQIIRLQEENKDG